MNFLFILILIVYSILLGFIFLYALSQGYLVWQYKKAQKGQKISLQKMDSLPKVTIQLPVYNEKYIVERLIDACLEIDYPKELLDIQILDDSTDETSVIIENKLKTLQKVNIEFTFHHIKRANRIGYKAGALKNGLETAKGDFIAIFDADFVPPKDFLLKTLPHFHNPKVGAVQTRWGHLNQTFNWLTQLQAFGLNAHFTIEQTGRNFANCFINFNGTAGIWRKKTIIDAGNWHNDTLTEDLDLSYRAQLKQWQLVYLENLASPAELPVEIKALKAQQFRWTKGGAQCVKKLLPSVLKSKNLSFTQKTIGTFHLLNSFVFVCVATTSILSIPILWIKSSQPNLQFYFHFGGLFILSFVILTFFYGFSYFTFESLGFKKILNFFMLFSSFLAFSMALSLHHSKAVFEGLIGKQSPFVRTPKFNISTQPNHWKTNSYLQKSFPLSAVFEMLLAIYFFAGCLLAFKLNDFGLLPLHFLLFFGFASVSGYSIIHHSQIKSSLHD